MVHSRQCRSEPWCGAIDGASDASTLASKLASASALLATCLLALACEPSTPALRPNILILTLDTTRADHLSAYGYFRETSPAFDAFARESILFENAIAPMATTLPSHVSVFTATEPLEHGVLANSSHGGHPLIPTAVLRPIALLAAEQGYRTAAFVSGTPVKRGSGIEVGFESFDQPAEKQRRGAATVDAALAWLARAGDEPFLLWIHLFDAHWPYDAPPPHGGRYSTDSELERYIAERRIPVRAPRRGAALEDARKSINAYDAEIRYQDAEIGRLLHVLRDRRDWGRTAVLLLGDHGEGLCQHGEAAHDGTWREQLHVPLLMRVPGVSPRRIAKPVSLVDALPTFLALIPEASIELSGDRVSGRNILAADALDVPILSQDTGRKRVGAHRYAITTSRWKYFRITELDGSLREELYDLDSDPHELANVAPSHPEHVVALRNLAEARIRSQTDRGKALRGGEPSRTKPMDPQLLEQLRALGYVESSDD